MHARLSLGGLKAGASRGEFRMKTDDLAFLNNIMDLLLDAVCVVDSQGRFLYVSAACERIFVTVLRK